jgi:hypothetical protein
LTKKEHGAACKGMQACSTLASRKIIGRHRAVGLGLKAMSETVSAASSPSPATPSPPTPTLFELFIAVAAAVGLVMAVLRQDGAAAVQASVRPRAADGAGNLRIGRCPAVPALWGACRAGAGEHRDRAHAAMKDDTLLTLAGYLALMSLFAIGGANSAMPEMQRVAAKWNVA